MSARYEWSHWEWWLPFLRGNKEPAVTPLKARPRWQSPIEPGWVQPNVPTPTPPDDLLDHPGIKLPEPTRRGATITSGLPYQQGTWANEFTIRILNARLGYDHKVRVPGPVDPGGVWLQGNPTPGWVLLGGNSDRHVLIQSDDGWLYEFIGCQLLGDQWFASNYGIFDRDSNLVEGRGAIVCDHPLGDTIWQGGMASEPLHVLSLVMRGDDLAEPTWPWFGQRVQLSNEALQRIPDFAPGTREWHFVASLMVHGAVVDDHGGYSKFRHRAGRDLDGIDWQGWTLSVHDLVAVNPEGEFAHGR